MNKHMNKQRQIEQQLETIDRRLANAEAYVAKGANVEGAAFLHFDDWDGKSGHPLWMKNFMIPATKRGRARKEKALEAITNKEREKRLTQRRRARSACAHPAGETAIDSRAGGGAEPHVDTA
jgi:hypothetical protein